MSRKFVTPGRELSDAKLQHTPRSLFKKEPERESRESRESREKAFAAAEKLEQYMRQLPDSRPKEQVEALCFSFYLSV